MRIDTFKIAVRLRTRLGKLIRIGISTFENLITAVVEATSLTATVVVPVTNRSIHVSPMLNTAEKSDLRFQYYRRLSYDVCQTYDQDCNFEITTAVIMIVKILTARLFRMMVITVVESITYNDEKESRVVRVTTIETKISTRKVSANVAITTISSGLQQAQQEWVVVKLLSLFGSPKY